jgi:hypothetical protein
MKSFDELIAPDEASQRFTPLGLSFAGILTPESAARHIQHTVNVVLAEPVPRTVRDSFDRVRQVHIYGLFAYELFTAAGDLAVLLLQQAFAERFMSYYENAIPLVDQNDVDKPILAEGYEAVHAALVEEEGSHRKGEWFVKSRVRPGEKAVFRGSLGQFFAWARMEGLLSGQRSRLFDKVLVRMRNRAAHPTSYKLSMPTDTALTIRDVGEFVNRLWGARTPGGRIFPAPIARELVVLGWDPISQSCIQQRPDQLTADTERRHWSYMIVRAVSGDELFGFHSDYETTRYPAEHLSGPGSYDEAFGWISSSEVARDEIDPLDRWFVVRVDGDHVDPPRNIHQFAGLPVSDRTGLWHLIQADYPVDAFAHVRSSAAAGNGCPVLGKCDSCWTDTKVVSDWSTIGDSLPGLNLVAVPRPPVGARVEAGFGRWEISALL